MDLSDQLSACWAILFDRLPLATCVVDGQGLILGTNVAFGALLPTSIASGRPLPDLLSDPAATEVWDACARVLALSDDEHPIPLAPCPELHEGRAELVLTVLGLLTSIKGFAYALRTRHERLSDTRRQEYLEIIEAQGDYLTGIIDELLDMARQPA